MYFPTLCLDNFFNDPREIHKKIENISLERTDNIPGYRSPALHEIDRDLFQYINTKMLAALYPMHMNHLKFQADTRVQMSGPNPYDGWVHRDDEDGCILTGIVYLSDSTAGTSIYLKKDSTVHDDIWDDRGKHEYFENYENYTEEQLKEVEKGKQEINENFEESIIIKGKYNRLVLFDARAQHAAQIHTENTNRLIIISFFRQIEITNMNIQHAIPVCRSI